MEWLRLAGISGSICPIAAPAHTEQGAQAHVQVVFGDLQQETPQLLCNLCQCSVTCTVKKAFPEIQLQAQIAFCLIPLNNKKHRAHKSSQKLCNSVLLREGSMKIEHSCFHISIRYLFTFITGFLITQLLYKTPGKGSYKLPAQDKPHQIGNMIHASPSALSFSSQKIKLN